MNKCGIGAIINNTNNKRFIFKSKDVDKRIENYILQLDKGCHYNFELQKDWNEIGSENFSFETREITLNDDVELINRFNHHIGICNDIYNVFDYKKLFKGELSSKIEILTNKLYLITGKNEFKEKFHKDLVNLSLTDDDGVIFISMMKDKIKTDEINYYNFDFKFKSLLNELSQNKRRKIKNEKKKNLLNYLYSIVGQNSNSNVFEKMLENHQLTPDYGLSIRLEIEKLIKEEKITTNFEIDEKLDEILKREKYDKLQYENNMNMAYKKLYSLTGDHVPKAQFIYKLKSLGLSWDDGKIIKKEIERKIELNEISFAQVEGELEKEIKSKLKNIADENNKRRNFLLDSLYNITGKNEVSVEFKNKLASYDLHENIGIQIRNNIAGQIKNDNITDSNQLESKINNLILQKEKEDVEVRLKGLSKNEIEDILKMNSINSSIPFKTAKIAKLINIVPMNVLKDNMRILGHDIDISYVDNPKVIYCTNCGSENTADSKFCLECGEKLE